MEQLTIRLKSCIPSTHYSESFKKQVVREYEQGHLNKRQLKSKYGIGGKSRVLEWCRKYGKFAYPKQIATGRPMKDLSRPEIGCLLTSIP